MDFRLCSFNVENLFTRFDFRSFCPRGAGGRRPELATRPDDRRERDTHSLPDLERLLEAAHLDQEDDKRLLTAQAMAEAGADLYCLQEIDDFHTLNRFVGTYVTRTTGEAFENRVLFEGNDTRGIDVAAIARRDRPFYARSHAWIRPDWLSDSERGARMLARYPAAQRAAEALNRRDERVFRRDCLELELRLPSRTLTLFVCHFKSMGGGLDDHGLGLRQLEALCVREIVARKFDDPARALWAVCGDLNDALDFRRVEREPGSDGRFPEVSVPHSPGSETGSGLDPLLEGGFGLDLSTPLHPEERWSHYYVPGRSKAQLDHIIASPALADRLDGPVRFVRAGQPLRVPNTGYIERYPRVGWDRPKASDHCPIVANFRL